jgi:hypothetical protein
MVGARREHLERLRGYGFGRAEIVLIPPEDWDWLPEYLAAMPHGFSFHAPALRTEDYPDNPLKMALVDPVAERRAQAREMVRRELGRAAEWEARHLVVHLQRSLLMDEQAPPAGWGEREGLDLAVQEVGAVLEEGRNSGVTLHVENMMGSPLLYSPEAYRALAEALPEARFCLDVGHAALDGRYFGFAEREIAEALAGHLGSLHLYDNHLPDHVHFTRLRDEGLLRKYPVHPEHQGEPGWIDTQGCLEAALRAQPDVPVTFEVYYRLDEDHAHTAAGIGWTVDFSRAVAAAGR